MRPDQQELWLSDLVKKANIQREGLPAGIFANVAGAAIASRDVGHTIRLKMSRADARDALRACLGIRLLDERAKVYNITAAPEDIEAAVDRRKARFASNPALAGVSFEQFLQARGHSLDELRADAAVRAEALLWKLGLQQFPDEEADRRYAAAKEQYDGVYGEQRKISWILINAAIVRNELIKKTYQEADAELMQILPRATSAEEFGRLAVIYSKHEDSRKKNGDMGWAHRREPGYDPALLAAVFAADAVVGKALGPVHTNDGSALIFIHSTRPAPSQAALRTAVRSELVGELYRKIVDDSKITTYLDPKQPRGAESKPAR